MNEAEPTTPTGQGEFLLNINDETLAEYLNGNVWVTVGKRHIKQGTLRTARLVDGEDVELVSDQGSLRLNVRRISASPLPQEPPVFSVEMKGDMLALRSPTLGQTVRIYAPRTN